MQTSRLRTCCEELLKHILNNVGEIDKELGNCRLCEPGDAQHVDTQHTDDILLLMLLPTYHGFSVGVTL